MSFWSSVTTTLVDGASGLNPSSDPDALVVGPCSSGVVGQVYYVGSSTEVEGTFGQGKLVERLKDLLSVASSEVSLVVVRSESDQSGGTGSIFFEGSGTAVMTVSGTPLADADIVLEVLTTGALNEATAQLSYDGGDTFESAFTIPEDGIIETDCGVTLTLSGSGDVFVKGDTYSVAIEGASSSLSAILEAVDAGLESYTPDFVYVAQETDVVYWSSFGSQADSLFDEHKPTWFLTEPRGILKDLTQTATTTADSTTVTVEDSDKLIVGALVEGDGIADDTVISSITDSTTIVLNQAATATGTDVTLTFSESIDNYVNELVAIRDDFSHKFVCVCASWAEIITDHGTVENRNVSGILAGTVTNARVNQSIGEVRTFSFSNLTLPNGWTNAYAKVLDNAGYTVLRRYAGLSDLYFSNGRMMADDTSDYQKIEIVRPTFKAARIIRKTALKYVQIIATSAGIEMAKSSIESALESGMINAYPSELDSVDINIPSDQDIVNNGLVIEYTLTLYPILKSISNYISLAYAEVV